MSKSDTRVSDGDWIAVRVYSRCEQSVASMLVERGYHHFLPVSGGGRLDADVGPSRRKVLFPGYVFCRYVRAPPFRIVDVPKVIGLVGIGNDVIAIPESDIDKIRRMVNSGMRTEPWQELTAGAPIVIESGVLRGLSGVVVCTKRGARLVVSIPLLGRGVAVEVPNEHVRTAPLLGARAM